MSETLTLARPYARAAFESARATNALPAWSGKLAFAAQVIGDARVQASEIIDKAQQQANQILDKAKADALLEAARQKAVAQADIDGMVGKAREALRGQVAALAVQGARKIIQREINPDAHKALLDQLVTEI